MWYLWLMIPITVLRGGKISVTDYDYDYNYDYGLWHSSAWKSAMCKWKNCQYIPSPLGGWLSSRVMSILHYKPYGNWQTLFTKRNTTCQNLYFFWWKVLYVWMSQMNKKNQLIPFPSLVDISLVLIAIDREAHWSLWLEAPGVSERAVWCPEKDTTLPAQRPLGPQARGFNGPHDQ